MSSTPQTASTPARLPSLYQFFGPGGLLAKVHPAYEFRRGQLQMAEAVEQALEERRHLIVEAGTGTGKTLAYLLPVIRSGKRVIISTGTKNLQEQLYLKDVPFLEAQLGELRVCYMKGRGNYLCRKKLYDLTDQPVLTGLEEINHFRIISDWEKTTATGDRAELAELPENSALWPKLDARTDGCIGSECQQFERCFITEMRRRAAGERHHHRQPSSVLRRPGDQGGRRSRARCRRSARGRGGDLRRSSRAGRRGRRLFRGQRHQHSRRRDAARRGADAAPRRFAHVRGPGGVGICAGAGAILLLADSCRAKAASPSRTARNSWRRTATSICRCKTRLSQLDTELQGIPNKPEEVHALARRAEELRVQLGFMLEGQDRNTVFWIERRGDRRGGRCSSTRIPPGDADRRVAEILRTDAVRAASIPRC